MKTSGRFGWREALLLLGFVASVALAVVFAVRSFHAVTRLRQDEPIRPWMTVPYLARTYHVPPETLYRALGLPVSPHDRRPLIAIARSQNRPVQDLIAELHRAIGDARLASPTPPAAAPPPPAGGAP